MPAAVTVRARPVNAQLLLRADDLDDVHVSRRVGLDPVPVLLHALVVDPFVHLRFPGDQKPGFTCPFLRIRLLFLQNMTAADLQLNLSFEQQL